MVHCPRQVRVNIPWLFKLWDGQFSSSDYLDTGFLCLSHTCPAWVFCTFGSGMECPKAFVDKSRWDNELSAWTPYIRAHGPVFFPEVLSTSHGKAGFLSWLKGCRSLLILAWDLLAPSQPMVSWRVRTQAAGGQNLTHTSDSFPTLGSAILGFFLLCEIAKHVNILKNYLKGYSRLYEIHFWGALSGFYLLYYPMTSCFLFWLCLPVCFQILSVIGESLRNSQGIYRLSKCLLLNDLFAKDKIVTFQWRSLVNTLVTKSWLSTSPHRTDHHVPVDETHWEGPSHANVTFLPKMCHLYLFVSKCQTHVNNDNWLVLFKQSHVR